MDQFTASNGQFLLNGQPVFVHAAEFHYFRTPREHWRHRLGLLQTAGFNTLAFYIPWLWHQEEEDVSDFGGHSHPMRDLSGFMDLATDMDFYLIPRPGPYIMAETINEGIPPWVFAHYPRAALINQEDQAYDIASYLQADFLACVKKWYGAVFEVLAPHQITRGGKIIMMQLDNEMGMIHWVRNFLDTNPDTMTRLAAYLKDQYGDRLEQRYPTEDLEQILREGLLHPNERYGEKILADYRRFYRIYLREYAVQLLSMAHDCGLEVLPVINIHGFGNGGKTFPIGLSQLVEVLRLDGVISATDVYPLTISDGTFHELLLVNEMTKALQNREQALFSIEFQSGGNHDFGRGQTSMYDLHSRLCISTGMRAINHYLFFGGENHPILSPVKRHDWGPPVRIDGTLRSHYHRYPRLSAMLTSYGRDLVVSQPQTVTTIGFILDDYMTEVNNAFTQETTQVITHQRDVILFDQFAKALSVTHRPFNALELGSSSLDPQQTPLLWVMIEQQCSAEIQGKLVDYARHGGKLVLAGRMCVEDDQRQPCTILKDALGIEAIQSDPPFQPRDLCVFAYEDIPVSFCEIYTGTFDEIFAVNTENGVTGFVKELGAGTVLVFGAALPAETLVDIDIVHQMALRMGCPPLFELTSWVDTRLSTGENGSFLFVINYQDDPVETQIFLSGDSLFDGSPVRIPARRGLTLALDWRLRPEIHMHYCTAEIREVIDNGATITLRTDPPEFWAAMTLSGYRCADARPEPGLAGNRYHLHGKEGVIFLKKIHEDTGQH
jgi:beta-galactosidase